MEKIVINGGGKLGGEIKVSSAKNAVLPIIAASILSDGVCCINNAPMLNDVIVISKVLESLNADVTIDKENVNMIIDSSKLLDIEPDNELVRKMRASFLIMGPMLTKFGRFKISLPGGCNIGSRPIDLHLKGFMTMGAKVNMGHGFVEVNAQELHGGNIYLDFPSVGATENIMMAATLAKGKTVIENAAAEPEIQDLADFLNSMGAKVNGAGTGNIIIEGVDGLNGVTYTPIYDRIEAGTFMVAAAITKSKIKIKGAKEAHLKPVIAKLTECGVCMDIDDDSITVYGDKKMKPMDIKTLPYPGFPTDMQAQMMSLLSIIKGTSLITETVFENRFMHVQELRRMGANIKIDGRSAVIEGVPKLFGANVKATDLRAGAALILSGLIADGKTTIEDIYHIDRGYVNIEEKFRNLGADIKRIEE
jgi:UDP-N-acetylglucosamine 1-carboxyvinyltransferase